MKKTKNKNIRLTTENYDDFVLALSMSLLTNKRTKLIVMPYLKTLSVEEATPCLKSLAGLLIVDDDERQRICKETLGNQADFILMIVRELDRIIEDDVKKKHR